MNERGIWYFLSHLLIIFTETNSIFLCFNYSNHHVCIKINVTNSFRSLMPTATFEVNILLELGFVESSSETNFTRATKPSSRRMLTVCRRVRFWLFYQIGVRMYCLRLRIDYIRRRILAFPADQQVVGLMLAAGYLITFIGPTPAYSWWLSFLCRCILMLYLLPRLLHDVWADAAILIFVYMRGIYSVTFACDDMCD